MVGGEALDTSTATVVAALVGALAALVATFVTLLVTRRLDDRRWEREREHRESVERRAAYAEMLRAANAWREATVDLVGEPKRRDWKAYWEARQAAMEAAAELLMIGSPLAVETIDEAMDQLLDVSWDYENNGPWAVESGPLWARMKYIDARLMAFQDLARAEFGLPQAREDPRAWLETPELVRRRVRELEAAQPRRPQKTDTAESQADAKARIAFEESMQRARRAGTTRRLVYHEGLSEDAAHRLMDEWEAEASSRGLLRNDERFWVEANIWLDSKQREVWPPTTDASAARDTTAHTT